MIAEPWANAFAQLQKIVCQFRIYRLEVFNWSLESRGQRPLLATALLYQFDRMSNIGTAYSTRGCIYRECSSAMEGSGSFAL